MPPSQKELVSDGCKTDLPLATAEPISDVVSVSVVMYLRRGKTCCTLAAGRDK